MSDNLNTTLAIISLTIIEIVALFKNIDSNLLLIIVGAIAGLSGYNIKRVWDKNEGK